MSSGEGMSGEAETASGADGTGTAAAGVATDAKRTTAAHSTAVLRPDPDNAICRDLATVRPGVRFWMRHDDAPQLLPSSPRLRDHLHISNSSHINNINHKSVIRRRPGGVSWSGVLVCLVLRVAGRFKLEGAVVGIEMGAQASDELVQQLVGAPRVEHSVLHHNVG
jgi:hypothetical protein